MHHYALPQDVCPMKALAARTHHLYAIAPEDASLPISYIENTKHVITADITLAICEILVLSRLLNSFYLPVCISAHSLRAIGYMALRLNDLG